MTAAATLSSGGSDGSNSISSSVLRGGGGAGGSGPVFIINIRASIKFRFTSKSPILIGKHFLIVVKLETSN